MCCTYRYFDCSKRSSSYVCGSCGALLFVMTSAVAGFGRFHFLIGIVLGWAISSDSVEILSISFVLPYASCDLNATDLQLGFLTAVGFAG